MAELFPLAQDHFDGEGLITRDNGKPDLRDLLNAKHGGTYGDATRPVTLAQWQTLHYQNLPDAGLTIWNTDDNALNVWDGTAWRDAMGVLT